MTAAELRAVLQEYAGLHGLTEHQVKTILSRIGLPAPAGFLITAPDEDISERALSYPLVAKLSSSKTASKSELKGVSLGINNIDELRREVNRLRLIPGAEGVLVEEMSPRGVEVIIGGIIDKQFGPVVMFGLGGVFVELFRDVAFALAPLDKDGALALVRQVKGFKLLEGYRGSAPVDKEALLDMVVTVSDIISTGLAEEIDLNPVALYPDGAMILDAKMSLKRSG